MNQKQTILQHFSYYLLVRDDPTHLMNVVATWAGIQEGDINTYPTLTSNEKKVLMSKLLS